MQEHSFRVGKIRNPGDTVKITFSDTRWQRRDFTLFGNSKNSDTASGYKIRDGQKFAIRAEFNIANRYRSERDHRLKLDGFGVCGRDY